VQVARDTTAVKPEDAKGADFAVLLRQEPESYVTDQERKAAEAGEETRFRGAADNRCKG
jgi:hypothetical protein